MRRKKLEVNAKKNRIMICLKGGQKGKEVE